VSNASGLSRGDRNRNARLARLRELVPPGNAIVGIDLADDKQAAVVTDHDGARPHDHRASLTQRPAAARPPSSQPGRGRARMFLEDPPRAEAWAAPPAFSASSIHAVGNNPLAS
jgi:hypothetical protein